MDDKPAPSTVLPIQRSPTPRLLNLLLGIGALALVAISGYLYLENMNLKKQLITVQDPAINSSVCEYNGVTYQVGESFPADDGCNSCSCTETGEVACTLMACELGQNPSNSIMNTSWQTYFNEESGLSFSHPASLKPVSIWQVKDVYHAPSTIFISKNPKFFSNSPKCNSNLDGSPAADCLLPGENLNQNSDITEILLDGRSAKQYYILTVDNEVAKVIDINSSSIQVAMSVATHGAEDEFDQILSTFEFTE